MAFVTFLLPLIKISVTSKNVGYIVSLFVWLSYDNKEFVKERIK